MSQFRMFQNCRKRAGLQSVMETYNNQIDHVMKKRKKEHFLDSLSPYSKKKINSVPDMYNGRDSVPHEETKADHYSQLEEAGMIHVDTPRSSSRK